jgi:3-oxoacyl-[acyl-carrier protein] reductase
VPRTDEEKVTDLEGIVTVITGGTKGIGGAIADALVGRGGRVVVASRSAHEVEAKCRALSELAHGEAHGLVCDVRHPEQCERLVKGAVERFGRLDVLVNNAGVGRFGLIQELSIEDWDLQLATNLDGVFYCSRAAVPHLVESQGWIVNIGSLAGRNSFSGGVAYNASKFGLLGMSEAMMLDLRHEGVRVTCVMPGSVNTEFFADGPDPAASWRLKPKDVAQAVIDLLSFPKRALPSRIELRPSQPPKK